MCGEQRFASMAYADGMDEAPVIGTVEHRPPIGADQLPPRRPVARESAPGCGSSSTAVAANELDRGSTMSLKPLMPHL